MLARKVSISPHVCVEGSTQPVELKCDGTGIYPYKMATSFGHTKDDRLDLTHWQSPLELSTAISESQKELDTNELLHTISNIVCLRSILVAKVFTYCIKTFGCCTNKHAVSVDVAK